MERNKFYTVMVVPSSTSKVRRLKVYKRTVKFLALGLTTLALVATVTSIFVLKDYFQLVGLRETMHLAREESVNQKFLIDKIESQVNDLQSQLFELSAFDHRLRVLADLETDNSLPDLGMGGPEPENINLYFSEEDRQAFLERLDHDLNQLQKDFSRQQDNFIELVDFFGQQQTLLSATPSVKPTNGWYTSGFGPRSNPFTDRREFHKGLDIAGRIGTPVIAPADGTVVFSGVDSYLGKALIIDHGFGFKTYYGHNSRNLVNVGQEVQRGQIISLMGDTGRSSGPHLHYQITKNGIPIDPKKYILN